MTKDSLASDSASVERFAESATRLRIALARTRAIRLSLWQQLMEARTTPDYGKRGGMAAKDEWMMTGFNIR
jgi:hypothetical protein